MNPTGGRKKIGPFIAGSARSSTSSIASADMSDDSYIKIELEAVQVRPFGSDEHQITSRHKESVKAADTKSQKQNPGNLKAITNPKYRADDREVTNDSHFSARYGSRIEPTTKSMRTASEGIKEQDEIPSDFLPERRSRVPLPVDNEVTQATSAFPPIDAHTITHDFGLPSTDHISYTKSELLLSFQALGDLGWGSMGYVEKVRYKSNRPFVRKKVSLQRSAKERKEYLEILHNEVDVMKSLSHKHIVQVIGSYSVEATTFAILMFPICDGNLEDLLQEMESYEMEKLSGNLNNWDLCNERWGWLCKWQVCLASALTYIHSRGIRHEDIKPKNIVYRDDNVYLTDFSSCTRFKFGDTTSTASAARTTRLYQAPELSEVGETSLHGRGADIFSLGCVFVEMEVVLLAHMRTQQQLPWQIDDLRSFCFPESDQGYTSGADPSYGRAVSSVVEWLERSSPNSPFPIVNDVLRPMLLIDRKLRPSAEQVQQRLLAYPSRQKYCACHRDLPLAAMPTGSLAPLPVSY
ncbi:MAG: hypothetical protein Q9220_006261 [cf. Caloplaca sp. 1 TL-2023]